MSNEKTIKTIFLDKEEADKLWKLSVLRQQPEIDILSDYLDRMPSIEEDGEGNKKIICNDLFGGLDFICNKCKVSVKGTAHEFEGEEGRCCSTCAKIRVKYKREQNAKEEGIVI